jgi:hypothetical protein
MHDRIVNAVAVALFALVAARCEKRSTPPKPRETATSRPSSFAPSVLPSSSPLPPKVASDCEQKHWENPWRPLQTTENPVQSVACGGAGCVPLTPVVSKGEACPERCRRVTITPRVASPDPPQNERIQKLLDAQVVDATSDDCWLTFLDYTVHHDAHGILDITFRMSGRGAYPSTQTAHVTVDIATGARLRAADVFSSRTLPELSAAMNTKVLASWRRASKEHAEVHRGRETPRFASEHLDGFIVHADGITFFFDYGLPHAVELATPTSEFPWSKRDIARFIDPKGPLRLLGGGD